MRGSACSFHLLAEVATAQWAVALAGQVHRRLWRRVHPYGVAPRGAAKSMRRVVARPCQQQQQGVVAATLLLPHHQRNHFYGCRATVARTYI